MKKQIYGEEKQQRGNIPPKCSKWATVLEIIFLVSTFHILGLNAYITFMEGKVKVFNLNKNKK